MNIKEGRFVLFLPDVIGGVFSVFRNIVEYSDFKNRAHFIAYSFRGGAEAAINSNKLDLFIEKVTFNSGDNKHFIVRELRKKMPHDVSCVLATDQLELQMFQLCKLRFPLVFFVMGDFEYYYKIAEWNSGIIDHFICISNEIYLNMLARLPLRAKDITLNYFPTPSVKLSRDCNPDGFLRIIFVARIETSKNPLLIKAIDDRLRQLEVKVEWTIVGDGPMLKGFRDAVADRCNFEFKGYLSNTELHKLYLKQDLFVLTSESEGLPVSMIEAMKSGLVPIVSDIPGGIREIVRDGRNGFLCEPCSVEAFADRIICLDSDRSLLEEYSVKAKAISNEMFNPYDNSKRIELTILKVVENVSLRKRYSIHDLSRLDKYWIPNIFVRWLRRLIIYSHSIKNARGH